MAESVLTLRFKKLESEVLDQLVSSGLFATKSEAVRSALLKLALDLDLFERKKLWQRLKRYPQNKENIEKILQDVQVVKHETARVY